MRIGANEDDEACARGEAGGENDDVMRWFSVIRWIFHVSQINQTNNQI